MMSLLARFVATATLCSFVLAEGMPPMSDTPSPVKSIGYIVFPGIEVLDVFGPISALNMLSHTVTNITMSIISASLDPVSSAPLKPSENGDDFAQLIVPTHTLAAPPAGLDVLIVAGGPGARAPAAELQPYFDFIKEQYPNLKYLISICTGATFLARAGVLDGRKATSNKFSWQFGTGTGPNVEWVPEARWVVDGNIWSTSGVAAGMDGIFAWIGELWGEEKAARIANILEYERQTDPSIDPFAAIWNVTAPGSATTTPGAPTTSVTITTSIPTATDAGHSHDHSRRRRNMRFMRRHDGEDHSGNTTTTISPPGPVAAPPPVSNIGYIVFPGFEVLDFFGPISPLNMLSHSVKGVTLSVISKTLDPVSSAPLTPSEHGSDFAQSVLPSHTLASPPKDLDVLIVPGGPGARANATELQPYFDFIREQYPNLKYLISVCTGATFLARAGVLDGKKATSNKFSWAFGTSTGPNVDWVPEARWVVDGNIWTTSGVAAGMDGIFAWIDELWGEEKATRIANILEYERQTDPSVDPFAAVWNVTKPEVPSTPTTSTELPTATPTQCKAKGAARRRML